MPTGDKPGLPPQAFTEQRGEAITESVKSLLLMNGGAAVAMLAFLQAIWATNPYLSKFVIGGIALFSIGVLLAGFVQLFRDSASFNSRVRAAGRPRAGPRASQASIEKLPPAQPAPERRPPFASPFPTGSRVSGSRASGRTRRRPRSPGR